MQAYGTSKADGERYQSGDVDFVTTSQGDMTMISGKGLNITGIHHKRVKTGSSKASQAEDGGRLDTQEDEFDL